LRDARLEVVRSVHANGLAADEILNAATEHSADLIVIGSRGQKSLTSLLIGSTAANLCEIAGRPVLMVP